ncbi:YaeQ family protein [Bordetella sp. 2513F-2]
MALRATIYKADLNVADTDRHYYGSHGLTVARHPSETEERMMVRLAAFALHASEGLAFTKGLSDTDEPDIWRQDLTGAIELWIEVGQPDERRILRACGRAEQVVIYCYGGHASQVWWGGVRHKVERARNLRVVNLPAGQTSALAELAERGMQLNVNIADQAVYVSAAKGEATLEPEVWREASAG